jgi:hypothetical protein
MMQLSIFDDLDAQEHVAESFRLAAHAAQQELNHQPHQCSHCGEWSPNKYMRDTNHGIVFNGWCGRRFWLNSWAKPGTWAEEHKDQFETSTVWLAEHGWVACDEHDRANWPEGHIPYWEVKK